MPKILDLSAYREETADITMQDGKVLHLRKPSERMVIHILQMRDLDDSSPSEEVLSVLNRVLLDILNTNADGYEFKMDGIRDMTLDVKLRIIQAYADWATELQSNPTTPSPSSPAAAETMAKPARNLRALFMKSRNTRG